MRGAYGCGFAARPAFRRHLVVEFPLAGVSPAVDKALTISLSGFGTQRHFTVETMNGSQQLLADYVATGSEQAFHELVARYINLVYGTALRLVDGDSHLAQDVCQKVFVDLAHKARGLSPQIMLGGWLHRHTCFVAAATMRAERRRQRRERQAMEMNAPGDHSAANLARIAPVLDDAVNELSAEDRTAVILRFFEQSDFRSIGAALGSNEEAARKRVHRAIGKLHALLTRRGVVLSASALAATLSSQVVTAAPAGLAVSVSGAALAATAGTGTTLTILNIMSMTKLKAAVVCAIVAAGVAVPVLNQHRDKARLRQESAALRQELAILNEQIARLERRSPLTDTPVAPSTPEQLREIMKLRGEVGRLRTENASITAASASQTNTTSPLDTLLADPAMQNTLLEQQRLAVKHCYNDFTNRVNLTPAQRDKLIDLLSSTFLDNVRFSAALMREGKTPAESEAAFTERDAALRAKVQALLGPNGLAQYDDYTRNLTTHFTVLEFSEKLGGSSGEKESKARQLQQVMQEETARVLANAGLAADYQILPRLNFRNLVSDQDAEQGLQLLDEIYAGVASRAPQFLTDGEGAQFAEFRSNAINANRLALLTARKVMASAK